jgi:hypothetical protein
MSMEKGWIGDSKEFRSPTGEYRFKQKGALGTREAKLTPTKEASKYANN